MSVLREPKTIADTDLLQDDPFKLYFSSLKSGRRTQDREKDMYDLVVQAMGAEDGGLNAARKWLRAALEVEADSVTEKDITFFVEFFWTLHSSTREAAHGLLHQVRRNCRLQNVLNLDTPISTKHTSTSLPSASCEFAETAPTVQTTDRDASSALQSASHSEVVADPDAPQKDKGKGKKRRKKGVKRRVKTSESIPSTSASVSELAEDSDDSQRTLCPSSDSDVPLSKKKRRSSTRDPTSNKSTLSKKSFKAVAKSRSQSVTLTPQTQDLPIFPQASLTRPCKSTHDLQVDNTEPRRLLKSRGARKSGSEKPKGRVVCPPKDTRPKKKLRLADGSVLELGPPARLKKLGRHASAPPLQQRIVRWNQEQNRRGRKSQGATPSVTPAPDVPSQPHAPTTTRKRKASVLEILETPNATDTVTPQAIIPNTVSMPPRILVPPRKPRATSTPLPAEPQDKFAVIDNQIQTVATVGLHLHQCTDPVAPEWATESPDSQPDVDNTGGITENTLMYPITPMAPVDENRLSYPLLDHRLIKMSPGPSEVSFVPYPESPFSDYAPCALFESGSVAVRPKPPLPSFPPIWAQSRQEVCESFDWFRSYQGGVYFNKNWVKGYLLGGFSASRDIFHDNGKLIVSHGGGKAALSLAKEKEMLEASDQLANDISVKALLNTYKERRAVALIIDDNYALFPYSLASKKCTYAVLGWYRIVKAWAEYQSDPGTRGKVIRYKFAFQWCTQQGDPWWWNMSETTLKAEIKPGPTAEPEDMKPAVTYNCPKCNQESPIIYEPPMCHQPSCNLFCCISGKQRTPHPVQYSPHFLRHHPIVLPEDDSAILEPSTPQQAEDNAVTTSQHFCRGWHCKDCGRLSSRFKWENFECRNCGGVQNVGGKFRVASEFRDQHTSKLQPKKAHPSIIVEWPYTCGIERGLLMQRDTYILPEGRGRIHILRPMDPAKDEVDQLLQLYQAQASTGELKFRRWPLRAHKCRGTLLTNYFSQNSGKPYQYVGGDENSVPFESAPSAVSMALAHIQKRIKQAELPFAGEFNEVLTAAYMEKQKMAYHSDAEKGLGPNVASLSLGASAHMYFRLHAKYSTDGTREVLRLYLRHGEVLVMEGAGVQIYYEHTVVPLNFRIAATARFIGKDHQ